MLFHKLLPVFVLPIGLLAILVILGTLRKWRWLALAALAAFVLASTPLVGGWLISRLERVHPRLKVAEVGNADAVFVLGGVMAGSTPPGFVPEWSDAVERFEAGVALAQADPALRLIFSGGAAGESEGARMGELAVARGMAPDRITVLDAVDNTADEARALARHAQEQGLKRVVLVTSAWHMPRSVRLFRRSGIEIVPFPVDYRGSGSAPWPWWKFLPSATGLAHTELAMRECYGLAFYAVFGR
ncbi:MAG TPA: YdcF family protein [Opitutaceae bacterium]|nr:YdcF family protein [Opitutaceae bacterium]